MSQKIVGITALTAALLTVAGTAAYRAADTTVQVRDGASLTGVSLLGGGTVADALGKAGVTLGPHDVVTPTPNTPVRDGDTITIAPAHQVTLLVNGTARTVWTTGTTVADALTAAHVGSASAVSQPLTRLLPANPLTLTVTTPKTVTLVVGKTSSRVTSTAATVSALLAEQGIQAAAHDLLTPTASTRVTPNLRIVLKRVTQRTVVTHGTVPYSTVTTNDASLAKGQRKTTRAGVNGVKTLTYLVTSVNGQVSSRRLVTQRVTTAPVSRQVSVGTKITAPVTSSTLVSGGSTNTANTGMWDRIAACESGGNWSINTGNGYYGGLQFDLSTWASAGGLQFAARPDLATKAQQITVANRVYAQRGLSPWGCASAA